MALKPPLSPSGARGPSPSELALQDATAAMQAGRPADAEQLAADVLKSNAGNLAAMQLLGTALLMQGRGKEAIAPLERAARQSRNAAARPGSRWRCARPVARRRRASGSTARSSAARRSRRPSLSLPVFCPRATLRRRRLKSCSREFGCTRCRRFVAAARPSLRGARQTCAGAHGLRSRGRGCAGKSRCAVRARARIAGRTRLCAGGGNLSPYSCSRHRRMPPPGSASASV